MIFILFFHSFKLYSLHLFNNSSFAAPFERNFHRNFFPIKSIKNFARREKEKKNERKRVETRKKNGTHALGFNESEERRRIARSRRWRWRQRQPRLW